MELATEAMRRELTKVLSRGDRRERAARVRDALRQLPERVAKFRERLAARKEGAQPGQADN